MAQRISAGYQQAGCDVSQNHCLDWLPQDWMQEETYFKYDTWQDTEIFRQSQVGEEYKWVTGCLDELLKRHGYYREGHFYRAERPNNEYHCFVLSFWRCLCTAQPPAEYFSHGAVHGLCAAPSSVTTLATEERRKGIASFRMLSFGTLRICTPKGEPPSFAARFCECFGNEGERCD